MTLTDRPFLVAGIPATNLSFYRLIRFKVGDPAALVSIPGRGSTLIIRDIEMQRARKWARADRIACPADFSPASGLSGDRETATAQAAAEYVQQAGLREIWTDRTLPMIYAHYLERTGVTVRCDPDFGVLERRMKDEQEIEFLQHSQQVTEQVMVMACRRIAAAKAGRDGVLQIDGAELTSERVREFIDIELLRRGFRNSTSIVAGGPAGADCHDVGFGPLRTAQPIIIDIFPQDRESLYFGDCTRTVVHGEIPDQVRAMHEAVVEAKRAAIGATRAGATGQQVHEAAAAVIRTRGYHMGLPEPGDPVEYCAMTHGTGHGVGLEVHEPPLLDRGGPKLVVGDAITIEPGLYCRAIGGIRVEDMVIVTQDGCRNLNTVPEGLDWS